jgi:hypothetical protein
MSRRLKVSAAQLGPIHRPDSRKSVVKRLVEMLKEADSRGSKFVVFWVTTVGPSAGIRRSGHLRGRRFGARPDRALAIFF